MNVLLVEDSRRLRQSLTAALEGTGYRVETAGDGREGLHLARHKSYDVIVLDIMLPEIDGFEVLEKLRADGDDTPVICLTARDALPDRVRGLHAGADDYLVKPFELEELLARVYAQCRRKYNQYEEVLRVDDLELDPKAKRVRRGGVDIDLPPRDYALLEMLMLRTGQVISRRDIEERIYDELVSPMSNVVDSAVCSLRKKIAVSPGSRPLIHTRRGQGYVLEVRPE